MIWSALMLPPQLGHLIGAAVICPESSRRCTMVFGRRLRYQTTATTAKPITKRIPLTANLEVVACTEAANPKITAKKKQIAAITPPIIVVSFINLLGRLEDLNLIQTSQIVNCYKQRKGCSEQNLYFSSDCYR